MGLANPWNRGHSAKRTESQEQMDRVPRTDGQSAKNRRTKCQEGHHVKKGHSAKTGKGHRAKKGHSAKKGKDIEPRKGRALSQEKERH